MAEPLAERRAVEGARQVGLGSRIQQRHGVHLARMRRVQRFQIDRRIFQEGLVGAQAHAVESHIGATEAREAQGVELDGGNRVLIDAQFHVHGNAAGAHHLVHGRQPRREAVVPGVHDGTVGEVHAIGSILGAGEVVAQDVQDMGCAALVEVGVQGVFRAREVTLDKVLAAADDAFRIALVPPVLAPGDIGHGGRPVLRLFNNVDAHRAKPHGGLQHHRQRQVGDVHRFQPRAIDGFVEQART